MTNMDLIQLRFPNRAHLTLNETCQLLGIAVTTARNQICQARKNEDERDEKVPVFPIPVLMINGRTYVSVLDLAEYLDSVYRQATDTAGRRRPGRPSKAEKAARALAAQKAVHRVAAVRPVS